MLLVVAWMICLMFAPLGWLVTGDAFRWGAAYLLCAAQVGFAYRRGAMDRDPARRAAAFADDAPGFGDTFTKLTSTAPTK